MPEPAWNSSGLIMLRAMGADPITDRRTPRRLTLQIISLVTALVAIARAGPPAAAGDRLIGHPKSRFPLTLYAEAPSLTDSESALRDVVAQWNQVFENLFHVDAFTWTNDRRTADILIRLTAGRHSHQMGETIIDANPQGVIRLPVRIDLNPPKPRGRTSERQMMFDVAAHELGHALGLSHSKNPRSIMCCEPGTINFNNPTTLAAYIEARRHPNLYSTAPELEAHYRRFWRQLAAAAKAR